MPDIGIVLGTGLTLPAAIPTIERLRAQGARVYGVNNTFEDVTLDSWVACDEEWHRDFGLVTGDFYKWHWSEWVCERFGYCHIPGMWYDGRQWVKDRPTNPIGQLSTDERFIAHNHCSSAHALNRATLDGCNPVLLVGHDFRYERGKPRHYFKGLSETPGEYPVRLRKHSPFDGLMLTYRDISNQPGLPRIVNCTPGSALAWFEFAELEAFLQ